MHNHIAVIHEHPMRMLQSFNADRLAAELSEGLFNLDGYRLDLLNVVCRAEDEIIGYRSKFGQFKN